MRNSRLLRIVHQCLLYHYGDSRSYRLPALPRIVAVAEEEDMGMGMDTTGIRECREREETVTVRE